MSGVEPIAFEGGSATIWVTDDTVRIAKHGIGGLWQGGAWRGDIEFPIAAITSVAWRDAGLIKEGYLRFVTAGGMDQRDPYHDQKAVVFSKRSQKVFEGARALIEERRTQLTQPRVASTGDAAVQLRKPSELRDSGIVTAEEFLAKKAELLARM